MQLLEYALGSRPSLEIDEQGGRCRICDTFENSDLADIGDDWLEREPLDRRALSRIFEEMVLEYRD